MEIEKKLALIQQALEAKKGVDIKVLDVSGRTSLCDYFVICSGKSAPQVRALCESVDETLSRAGEEKRRAEGFSDGRWAVLDYGDVLVHIFHDEQRLFYRLEKLWEDNSERHPDVQD